ncbi:MAG: phage tail protein I [Bacillota bacterium]
MSQTLLPPLATPLERSADLASDGRYPLPADLVSSVWSPDRCPANLLGYLAWGLSIDLWDENWPEVKKREVCRRAFDLHRVKTTAAGIKAHVELVGSAVTKITRPPARAHLRGAMDDHQRAAWLETLPQVRIYPFANRSVIKSRIFATGPAVHHQWHGQGWLRSTRGFDIYGRRATYIDPLAVPAIEQPVSIGATDEGLITRVYLRRHAPRRMFHGQGFTTGWLRATSAETNTLTVTLADENASFAVPTGVRPVNVRPQRIARGRVAPETRSFFRDRPLPRQFLRSSMGPLLIYDRIALADPTRFGARHRVRAFHGHGRFGIDPFTAEIRIKVPMLRRRRRSGAWHGAGFRQAASMDPLVRTIQAVRVSKAERDRILIDTTNVRQVRFASGLRFGEFTFGQAKEVA